MKNNVVINEHERVDDLHRKGRKIIQDPQRFCFGVDAVILTGFAQVKADETLLDLGTGTGIIPILLEAKTEGRHFTGIDILEESVEMAQRSVLLNRLEDKISIQLVDIKKMTAYFKASSFNVITTNPPYIEKGGGLLNKYDPKAIARHEILCTLEDIVRGAAKLIKPAGRFYMIHRPHRLADILILLRQCKLEPKKLRFIHSYIHKEPAMVLIEAVYGGRPMIKTLPPLILYNKDGSLTKEVYDIYYH